jgi:Ca2+-binding RTX toxin-like protein
VTLGTSGSRLLIKINGTTDQVLVENFLHEDNTANAYNPLQQIKFSDGTVWNLSAILTRVFAGTAGVDDTYGTLNAETINGQSGNDALYGRAGNDTLDGGAGDDHVQGDDGNDTVRGGDGNDRLDGGNGADTLDGGKGNDELTGDLSNDTYLFSRGSGADTISDYDATSGNIDLLSIGTGVAANQLWLRQVGSDLELSIIGTSDKSTIRNWYASQAHHVEQFKTSDGKVLLDSQVQNLVSAMAAFAPPAAGQVTLTPAYETALGTVIATSWK